MDTKRYRLAEEKRGEDNDSDSGIGEVINKTFCSRDSL